MLIRLQRVLQNVLIIVTIHFVLAHLLLLVKQKAHERTKRDYISISRSINYDVNIELEQHFQ